MSSAAERMKRLHERRTAGAPASRPAKLRDLVAQLLVEHEQLAIEVRGLRSALRRHLHPPSDTNAAELLCAIVAARGRQCFKSSELIGIAALNDRLRHALEAFDPLDARRLGKLLERLCGRDLGGLILHRLKTEGGAAIWSVGTVRRSVTATPPESVSPENSAA